MIQPFVGELIGTLTLVLLGNGVVAANLLSKSKAKGAGWLSIAFGWGIAVVVGVLVADLFGSEYAHINPAVSLAAWMQGRLTLVELLAFSLAQTLGAMAGAALVWMVYRSQYEATTNGQDILSTFATSPAVPDPVNNVVAEAVGTAMLVIGIGAIGAAAFDLWVVALLVGVLVVGIGLSLGGPTGYAINPARDLGPRLMHELLPVAHKKSSQWVYAWVPVVGPMIGALLAGLLMGVVG